MSISRTFDEDKLDAYGRVSVLTGGKLTEHDLSLEIGYIWPCRLSDEENRLIGKKALLASSLVLIVLDPSREESTLQRKECA